MNNNIDAIISEMTLEEKAILVNGATFFGTAGIDRLDIPRMQLLDGGTGINFEQLFGDMTELYHWSDQNMIGSTTLVHVIDNYYEPEKLNEEELKLYNWIKEKLEARVSKRCDRKDYAPGCFPPGILLGATWNKETVRKVGEALGMEANVFGVDMLLGTPNVNIHRDPLNGRLFEGYSEDPYLVSTLAPELVKGVQEYGVIANVKHFAANNQETNRVGVNEIISRRALEEIYLQGFKACVTEGKVKTVMSAYNKINGIPCTESSFLLKDKLTEWGFDGFVVSDWGAVFNPDKALVAGNDLVMPGYHEHDTVMKAVESGEISEEDLNQSVRNILKTIVWLNERANHNVYDKDELVSYTDEAAYEAAAQGIVMLKNDGTFPLKSGKKLIIIGSGAEAFLECGAGSAGITTNRNGNLYEELKDRLGSKNVVLAKDFCDLLAIKEKEEYSKDNTIVLVVASLGGMEGNDRKDLYLNKEDLRLMDTLYPTAVILNTCGPVDMSFDNDKIKGIWCTFLPGMGGAKAMADILIGQCNPSGKLPLTFPKRYEDTPTYINFPGDGFEVNYGEGIFVGYRYYDKKKVEPKYAFGYGLSYTDFEVNLIEVVTDADKVKDTPAFKKQITVKADITNIGDMAGGEVLQLYISDRKSTLTKPVKELKAFEKVYLEAEEKKEIEFTLYDTDFESYDNNLNGWFAEEGFYDIILATSSDEKDIKGRITVYMNIKSPYSYSMDSSIRVICNNHELLGLAYAMWDRNGLDRENIDNNYKYTAHRTLREVLGDVPEYMISKEAKAKLIEEFNRLAQGVVKE